MLPRTNNGPFGRSCTVVSSGTGSCGPPSRRRKCSPPVGQRWITSPMSPGDPLSTMIHGRRWLSNTAGSPRRHSAAWMQNAGSQVLAELADAPGVTLVIDDLHELTSPEARAQLTRLLTRLPPQVHAILTTRHDVRLGLHRLRLAGELAEIRAADLRFSERETRELLDASGIALSEAGATLLQQRTEGWAAGLRLAAISLAGHPDPERFVAEFSGSDRTVAEYLLAEMLDRQPGDVK